MAGMLKGELEADEAYIGARLARGCPQPVSKKEKNVMGRATKKSPVVGPCSNVTAMRTVRRRRGQHEIATSGVVPLRRS